MGFTRLSIVTGSLYPGSVYAFARRHQRREEVLKLGHYRHGFAPQSTADRGASMLCPPRRGAFLPQRPMRFELTGRRGGWRGRPSALKWRRRARAPGWQLDEAVLDHRRWAGGACS